MGAGASPAKRSEDGQKVALFQGRQMLGGPENIDNYTKPPTPQPGFMGIQRLLLLLSAG